MISNVFSENRAEKRISLVYDESISGFRALDFSKIDEIEGILRSGITVTVTGAETINVNVNGGNLTVSNEVEINNTQGNPIPVSGNINVTNFPSIQNISGTVTANVAGNLNGAIEVYDSTDNVSHKVAVQIYDELGNAIGSDGKLPIAGTVTANVTNFPSIQNISGTVTANGGDFTTYEDAGNPPAQAVQVGWYNLDGGNFFFTTELSPFPVQALNSITVGSLPAISGTVTATQEKSSNISNFNSSGTNGTVLIANSNRKELYIQNLSTGKLYVKYGEEASNNSFNFVLAANTSEEAGDGGSLSDQGYTGVVSVSGVNPKYISWERA